MKRSATDAEWAAEVGRRWQRRRWHTQQMDAAMAQLAAAFEPLMLRIVRLTARLDRVPILRWLVR